MPSHRLARIATAALITALPTTAALSAELLSPGDFIIAIDTTPTPFTGQSAYPDPNEAPGMAIDGDFGTKYLNFGAANSGFIITPNFGSSIALSLALFSANDAPERDPLSYALFGTNDTINSTDNSFGNAENWTAISSGALAPPAARDTPYPVVDFANAAAYTSYRLLFPTLVDEGLANSMQIAEVQLFNGAGATGTNIFAAGGPILAIDTDGTPPPLSPPAEAAANAIDGDVNTKFLNFGQSGAGFIVTPSGGPSIVQGMVITTANDFVERDPDSYEIYGTNDPITSPADGDGSSENWTLIQAGDLDLPFDRFTDGEFVVINNGDSYTSYRVVFPGVRDGASADSFQIAEIQLFDEIPEPGSFALMAIGGLALLRRRR
ncbi:PEP-CTERM sorting domain-containing protein [Phycisphaeraceae bacterium D3-23]